MRRVTFNPKLLRRHVLQRRKDRTAYVLPRRKDRTACFSTSSRSSEPFYGSPRPLKESESPPFNLGIALTSATTAFLDPERHDAVASLAEVTSLVALQSLQKDMMMHPIGQRILTDRPHVTFESIHLEKLHALPTNTFGYAYAQFLTQHGFNPNDRAPIQNPHVFASPSTSPSASPLASASAPPNGKELSYILLRYRQCHDFYHVVTDLPPSIPGELALKYVELFQTGLPVCALSATVGSWKLDATHRQIWTDRYLPWAIRIGTRTQHGAGGAADNGKDQQQRETDLWMLNVYWEEEFECDLDELRARLGVEVAPRMDS